jgi:hypothetical protein
MCVGFVRITNAGRARNSKAVRVIDRHPFSSIFGVYYAKALCSQTQEPVLPRLLEHYRNYNKMTQCLDDRFAATLHVASSEYRSRNQPSRSTSLPDYCSY